MLSRLITVPDGLEYKVSISEIKSSRINPSRKKIKGILYPAQTGATKELKQNKPEFLIDKASYAARGILASDTVSIEQLGTIRNKRLANLFISPVQYNPRTNVLEVITSMKINITYIFKGKLKIKIGQS